ncbi:MAG: hypothetical protein ACE5JU_09055 [Candidatus Binatia bacterium]
MEKSDLFYHGVITKLFPRNNMGLVRTESGREIAFSYNLAVLLGEVKSPDGLREGQKVGFDIGWTSNGLRVTKIKTYPECPPKKDGPELEG